MDHYALHVVAMGCTVYLASLMAFRNLGPLPDLLLKAGYAFLLALFMRHGSFEEMWGMVILATATAAGIQGTVRAGRNYASERRYWLRRRRQGYRNPSAPC